MTAPASVSADADAVTGAAIAAKAQQYAGWLPYVWGGSSLSSGADCSGFTMAIYASYGISLPHSSSAQAGGGRSISRSELQPGDLVFFVNTDTSGFSHIGIYVGDGEWYKLTLKDISVMDELLPDMSAVSRSLDVTVLHTLVLERAMGIDKENMAKGKNLTYTRSTEEAIDSVIKGKANCSFILNPTRVKEIGEVASANEKMPQKSTYFYPKIITGLVINPLY